jgi:hypothetical protein
MTNNIPGQRYDEHNQPHTQLALRRPRAPIPHGRHPQPHTWECSHNQAPKPRHNQTSSQDLTHTNRLHRTSESTKNSQHFTIPPIIQPSHTPSSRHQQQLSRNRSASVSSPFQPERKIVVDISKTIVTILLWTSWIQCWDNLC